MAERPFVFRHRRGPDWGVWFPLSSGSETRWYRSWEAAMEAACNAPRRPVQIHLDANPSELANSRWQRVWMSGMR